MVPAALVVVVEVMLSTVVVWLIWVVVVFVVLPVLGGGPPNKCLTGELVAFQLGPPLLTPDLPAAVNAMLPAFGVCILQESNEFRICDDWLRDRFPE